MSVKTTECDDTDTRIVKKIIEGMTPRSEYILLTDSKYRFRSNRSTSLVIELTEGITNSLNQKKYAAGVFIDLKKAFGTISHDRWMNNLELYGIRGIVLNWRRDCLDNRQQCVRICECMSSCLDIACESPRCQCWGQFFSYSTLMTDVK